MTLKDNTNDPALKSWVTSANQPDCHFPIQNLPFGVFTTAAKPEKRVGVAIGDQILDLSVIEKTWLIPIAQDVFSAPDINRFMSLGPKVWAEVRAAVSTMLDASSRILQDDEDLKARALVPQADAALHMPVQIGDYTDFYASKEHATNVGTLFRDPENALTPNWLHMPIGYNGRASTVVASGTDIHRPLGQIKPPGSDGPIFEACRKLDMELEIGAIVGTPNPMGQPITVDQANEMIFGYVILNDWSARDIQVWEYQPLGPFQAKAFASTISPWVVTRAAMEPFRQAGPKQDPEPLLYLRQKAGYNYNLNLQVTVQPEAAAKATTICKTNFKYMYWSSPQQLAHHAACGCAMRSGDLLGSGTISGQDKDSLGSFLELSWNGQNPMTLEGGESRTFIEDGDTISMTGWCQGNGYRIGFGHATGKILPAVQHPSLKEM